MSYPSFMVLRSPITKPFLSWDIGMLIPVKFHVIDSTNEPPFSCTYGVIEASKVEAPYFFQYILSTKGC